jgi:hypothetical protein
MITGIRRRRRIEPLLLREVMIGLSYGVVGGVLLRHFEAQGRRRAALDNG